jgi:hypothetical protein
MNDSSRMLFEQAQDNSPADYATINIGEGKEWITSRLYIGCVLLERMRGLKCLVFVENKKNVFGRFVAVSPISEVRWALAMRYPWLEAAFVKAYSDEFSSDIPNITKQEHFKLIKSTDGALEPHRAAQILTKYISTLQQQPMQTAEDEEWVALSDNKKEHAKWVTNKVLHRFLPGEAFSRWTYVNLDAPKKERLDSVVRRCGSYIATVGPDRDFIKLIDRLEILEAIATSSLE